MRNSCAVSPAGALVVTLTITRGLSPFLHNETQLWKLFYCIISAQLELLKGSGQHECASNMGNFTLIVLPRISEDAVKNYEVCQRRTRNCNIRQTHQKKLHLKKLNKKANSSVCLACDEIPYANINSQLFPCREDPGTRQLSRMLPLRSTPSASHCSSTTFFKIILETNIL